MVTSTVVQSVVDSLENIFGQPKNDTDAKKNIEVLSGFLKESKFGLEVYLSQAALISLSDEEYELLKSKIEELITKNNEKVLVSCPKCEGSGDLPPLRRGNHPSVNTSRKCTFCQGACMVTPERASQFTG